MTSVIEKLPHRRLEAWKWTDLRGQVSDARTGLSQVMRPQFYLPDGISISEGEGASSDSAMGNLAAQFCSMSWNVYVPANTQLDAPIVLDELTQGHMRLAIMVDKGASLNLVEYHRGSESGFANLDIHILLAEGASLERTIVQDDPKDMVRISTACIAMETGASLSQYALSFGGGLTRLETRLYGDGEGVNARINGAYLLEGQRHTDMTSVVHLKHPNSHIRQSVKGVVTDKARGVFQGKFHVERPAQFTDAEMRHDALMLSDRAQIRSKPELEIYADDVACAHGNTIGALDESALFYMRQRGIPLQQARALLMEAFLTDVFDDLEDEALQASLVDKLRTRLEALS